MTPPRRIIYDSQGHRLSATLPDTSVTNTSYYPSGQVKATWGSQTYPSFTYGDLPDSGNLVQTVTGPAHTVTNTWETTRNILATKVNEETISTHSIPSSFAYGVNAIGQRKTVGPVEVDNTPVSTYTPKWAWEYNGSGRWGFLTGRFLGLRRLGGCVG